MKKKACCVKVVLLVSVLTACLFAVPAGAAERVPVFVSIVPQKYFVERIGGEFVSVSVMVPPGASPATYEPRPRQMAAMTKAQAYFAVGVPFERAWLDRIAAANPAMRIVRTDKGIEKRAMAAHHHHEEEGEHHDEEHGRHDGEHEHHDEEHEHHDGEHEHHDEEHEHHDAEHEHHDEEHEHHDGEHEHHDAHEDHHGEEAHSGEAGEHGHHDGQDPHVWLAPLLVKVQAGWITEALSEIAPEHRAAFEANYNAFAAELDGLNSRIKTLFAGKEGAAFMVFHPSWGYFADAFGLTQVPIELEGKEPKPRELAALVEQARSRRIRAIFVQPQFSMKSANAIAGEIGGKVVVADPLAENWPENLTSVAERIRKALE